MWRKLIVCQSITYYTSFDSLIDILSQLLYKKKKQNQQEKQKQNTNKNIFFFFIFNFIFEIFRNKNRQLFGHCKSANERTNGQHVRDTIRVTINNNNACRVKSVDFCEIFIFFSLLLLFLFVLFLFLFIHSVIYSI